MASATPADRPGTRPHRAQVTYAGGLLTVKADNSSLNSILRMISQTLNMRISGGVVDQRVFGEYGPADPSAVLTTLLDGTGSNVLLRETAASRPAELILTPRTAGPTPPSPSAVPDEDIEPGLTVANQGPRLPAAGTAAASGGPARPYSGAAQPAQQTGPAQVVAGRQAAASGPVSIPQPINNVLGSPSNTSPTAGDYPVTQSVPLDSLPTPSTTPSQTGIVDAPNPPPAGSDTAALLRGQTTNLPGNTTIVSPPAPPNSAGVTGTAAAGTAAPGASTGTTPGGGTLTPQQVFEQLQKLRQQQSGTPPQ